MTKNLNVEFNQEQIERLGEVWDYFTELAYDYPTTEFILISEHIGTAYNLAASVHNKMVKNKVLIDAYNDSETIGTFEPKEYKEIMDEFGEFFDLIEKLLERGKNA